jgi:hypothetical protein
MVMRGAFMGLALTAIVVGFGGWALGGEARSFAVIGFLGIVGAVVPLVFDRLATHPRSRSSQP